MTPRILSFTESTAAGALCVLSAFSPTAQAVPRQEEAVGAAIRVFHKTTPSTGMMIGPSVAGDWAADYLAGAVGDSGKRRIEMFERLPHGWDGRGAQRLDVRSLSAARAFFNNSRLSPKELAVFMTPSGHIAVSWEDAQANDIEVEFAPTSTSVYLEANDEEETFPNDDLGQTRLAAKLRQFIA